MAGDSLRENTLALARTKDLAAQVLNRPESGHQMPRLPFLCPSDRECALFFDAFSRRGVRLVAEATANAVETRDSARFSTVAVQGAKEPADKVLEKGPP